jgi:DNA replication protein DnaC
MKTLAKTDLLILDDWGLCALHDDNRRDLLELMEDRYDTRLGRLLHQMTL